MATSFTLCMLTLIVLLEAATATSVQIVNPGESRGRCRQQIERQRLSSCRRYLRDSSRFEESRPGDGGWREEFPRCCEVLEQINEPYCRCEALKQVVEEGGMEGREMREMLSTARSLPALCRISPPHFCQINISGLPNF